MSNNNAKILSEPVNYQELMSIRGLIVSGIYKIENLINHKVYIGQSVHVIRRLKEHVRYEYNEHLKNAFIKYGLDNFSFEIIRQTYDLDYWEIFLIQLYQSINDRYGYNKARGGETPGNYWDYFSKDECEIIKNKIRKARMKQTFTEETKQKRLNSIADFWNSPEGLAKKKELSERSKQIEQPKDLHWYNNGVKCIRAKECPDGYVPGRLGDFSYTEEYKQRKRDYEKNLTLEQRRVRSEKLSEAHKGHHFTEERKKHIGDGNRGRKYFNNGEIEVMRYKCPPGFAPGRCPKARAAIKSGMNQ